MNKTLTYSSFAISSLVVIFLFLTAKTYSQLAIAVMLYPLLAYLALKMFPNSRSEQSPTIVAPITYQQPPVITKAQDTVREKVDVADIDKRTFLKLIGTAGVSFFVFSLLGRRVENLLFGDSVAPALIGQQKPPEAEIGTTGLQTTEGYKISEIDEGLSTYYGFVNKSGGWLIMKEETDSSSFRYAKGKTQFETNWENRANLDYDYYHNLF